MVSTAMILEVITLAALALNILFEAKFCSIFFVNGFHNGEGIAWGLEIDVKDSGAVRLLS
jgi:hypothetical protein